MSGHSKWAKIKRQKGANDQKRGALFSKLSKNITITASEGGGDPDLNFALRLAIDKAKAANMPSNNIDRAIKSGTGEGGGDIIRKIIYEGTGPAGVGFIVACTTDNNNRTVAEVRKIFENAGGAMGNSGSQTWQFEEKGIIEIKAERRIKSEKFGQPDTFQPIGIDDLEMELIEVDGVDDIQKADLDDEFDLVVYTQKKDFSQVHKNIESLNIKIISAELRYVPKEKVALNEATEQKVLDMMGTFDDHDDVDAVYTNADV